MIVRKTALTTGFARYLLVTALMTAPAFADPVLNPQIDDTDARTYAEFRKVPGSKMTYRSLHQASLERKKRAEMAAMEIRLQDRETKPEAANQSGDESRPEESGSNPRY
jgi:hypothetical protein